MREKTYAMVFERRGALKQMYGDKLWAVDGHSIDVKMFADGIQVFAEVLFPPPSPSQHFHMRKESFCAKELAYVQRGGS